MSARAGEWKLGGDRRAPNLARLCLVALVLPYTGGKKEKVVNPRGRLQPETRVGTGPPGHQQRDEYIRQELYTRKNRKDKFKDKNGLNRTRHITRETEACILTS